MLFEGHHFPVQSYSLMAILGCHFNWECLSGTFFLGLFGLHFCPPVSRECPKLCRVAHLGACVFSRIGYNLAGNVSLSAGLTLHILTASVIILCLQTHFVFIIFYFVQLLGFFSMEKLAQTMVSHCSHFLLIPDPLCLQISVPPTQTGNGCLLLCHVPDLSSHHQ